MGVVTTALCVTLALIAAVIVLVAILRRRPGLRRRREDPAYEGPARRVSDCASEVREAVVEALHGRPEQKEVQVEEDVKMTPSPRKTKGSK